VAYSRIDYTITGLEESATGSTALSAPLIRAWEELRMARSWQDDGTPAAERQAVLAASVARAAHAVRNHVRAAEGNGSWLRKLGQRPAFEAAVAAQMDDHAHLLDTITRLEELVASPGAASPGGLVRFAEQCIYAEIALARHLSRLRAILGPRPAAQRAPRLPVSLRAARSA
jgi:hypothetical protein